ncbi:MAG: PEP-CTERM sorting domain-containing protein [Phycisphaera sp. TMED9]|nr:MAG: PEP-CTERM sorting domain-containing protein [Phycisphaera sp. TMED9]
MKSRFALGAALVLAAPVAIASAEIDLAWTGLGPEEYVNYSYDGAEFWDSSFRTVNTYGFLGLYLFNGGEYEGYCYDLDAPVSQSPMPYEVETWTDLDAETQDRARFLASLYDQWYDAVKITGDDAMGAALAFLTNEIMEENYDFIPGTWYLADVQAQSSTSEGAVQFSDYSMEAQAYYDTMLASLDFGTDAMLDNLVFYNSTGVMQDFVGMVPAPSALALLGIAGLARRRRRN